MKRLTVITVIFLIAGASLNVSAQKGYEFPDSVAYKKNIIRWNLTPFLLWSKLDINIGYERVLSPYRSFSVNVGYFELPQFTKQLFDSLQIQNTTRRSGFSVSGDYRFYFKNRNRNMAPDGLYWGVFGSFHNTRFETDITVIDDPSIQGDITFGAKINIFSAGVELGYQFIIKERLSIDLVFMGPAFSAYTSKLTLDGDLTVDEKDEYLQAIYHVLKNSIPGFEKLVQDREVKTTGTNMSVGFGLRYLVQIGYRF